MVRPSVSVLKHHVYLCIQVVIITAIGFSMSCIKDEVISEASVDLIDSFSIISSTDTFKVSIL